MVAERQKAINVVNDGMRTLPMDEVIAIRDYNMTLVNKQRKLTSGSRKQEALEALMKHKGSVELPEDRKADKDAYLRSKV